MKINKLFLAMVIGAGALASQFASAAPTTGNITFNGALTADTCVVTNGTSGNITVTLPTLPAANLSAGGTTAGSTPFQIVLTSCPTLIPVRALFSAGSAGITTDRLNNTGSAGKVQIQLLNSASTVMTLSQTTAATQGDLQVVTDATGAATLKYTAQYYANGGASSAGSVTSNAVYTIVFN
jgi:major type 1 subunit fimbrin (pilin)